MIDDLLIVLTARCGSERYPNKVIAEIDGTPLIVLIAERLHKIGGHLVLGTTCLPEDDTLESIGSEMGIPVWRHPDHSGRAEHHAVVARRLRGPLPAGGAHCGGAVALPDQRHSARGRLLTEINARRPESGKRPKALLRRATDT